MTGPAPKGRRGGPGAHAAVRRRSAALAALALGAFGVMAGALAETLEASGVSSPKGMDGFVTVDRLPQPVSSALAEGRAVWGENCQNCHGGDALSGAPKITSEKKWGERIASGLPQLFRHAKQGFLGPTFAEMPARGGNPDLTDSQVEAAVAFMVWASGGAAEVEAWLAASQE